MAGDQDGAAAAQAAPAGQDFESVLAEAQRLGYAEADPSFDVDGIDTAHKLAILTALAFGCEVDFGSVYVAGIRNVSALDVAYAEDRKSTRLNSRNQCAAHMPSSA